VRRRRFSCDLRLASDSSRNCFLRARFSVAIQCTVPLTPVRRSSPRRTSTP
jgi:hypothetical protein